MADKSYDAVIVGGGHHGLITGCYLARAGLSVGVFERRYEIGGGAASEDLPLSGWPRDTHAHFIRFFTAPAYHDFKLYEKGLKLIFPPGASNSCLWPDGTGIAMRALYDVKGDTTPDQWPYLPQNMEYNAKQVATFSQKDADTCYALAQKYQTVWKHYVDLWHYSIPPAAGERDIDQILIDEGLVNPDWATMDTGSVAYDIFESPQLREYYMRLAQGHTGIYPDQPQHLMITLHTLGSMLGGLPISISAGGTHNIAHALQRALMEEGGDFFVLSEVDKIIIEGNRAKGIKLVDGTEIEAKKMVICNTNIHQTVNQFIGHENTPAHIVERVKKVHSDMGAWWFWATYYELPKYIHHEEKYPEIMTQRQYMMPLKPDWFRYEQYEEFKKGMLPKYIYFHISHPSYFDPRYAPEGHHSSVVEFYGPPCSYVGGMDWYDKCDPDVWERVVEQWQWYAPNMKKENFIAWHNTTVRDMAEKLRDMPNGCWTHIDMTNDQMGQRRPIPEYSRYKTHLDNVYMCGSTMHPGGALHGICGYNAYKRIAEDYGLEKPWEKAGRPF